MNIKEIEERIELLRDMYVDQQANNIFNASLNLYTQLKDQIDILKSIRDFKPDPLGIDPERQLAAFARKTAIKYLEKINEVL